MSAPLPCHGASARRRRTGRRLLPWLLMLLAAAWGFLVEPRLLVVREQARSLPGWPGPPLTLVFVSDLHVGAPHVSVERLAALVARINAHHPDLVLIGGDYVDHGVWGGPSVPVARIAAELGRLRAPLGVYATLGNHDRWEDGGAIVAALAQAGLQVLENRARRIPLGNGYFSLVGLGDDSTGHARIDQAFAGVDFSAPVLALMHDPANAPELPRGVSLALAGHTHGGQVYLPLIGALATPGRSPLAHAWGWQDLAGLPLYVTGGIGTSVLPLRFNMRPEYLVLHLSAP